MKNSRPGSRISFLPGFAIAVSATLFALNGFAGKDHPAASTADQFSEALKQADETAVRSLLDEHVLIFESGNVESSLEEYASHHMSADMKFMSDIEKEVVSRTLIEEGDITVINTHYRMHGSYGGKPYDKVSLETLVLRKIAGTWKIVHVHWS